MLHWGSHKADGGLHAGQGAAYVTQGLPPPISEPVAALAQRGDQIGHWQTTSATGRQRGDQTGHVVAAHSGLQPLANHLGRPLPLRPPRQSYQCPPHAIVDEVLTARNAHGQREHVQLLIPTSPRPRPLGHAQRHHLRAIDQLFLHPHVGQALADVTIGHPHIGNRGPILQPGLVGQGLQLVRHSHSADPQGRERKTPHLHWRPFIALQIHIGPEHHPLARRKHLQSALRACVVAKVPKRPATRATPLAVHQHRRNIQLDPRPAQRPLAGQLHRVLHLVLHTGIGHDVHAGGEHVLRLAHVTSQLSQPHRLHEGGHRYRPTIAPLRKGWRLLHVGLGPAQLHRVRQEVGQLSSRYVEARPHHRPLATTVVHCDIAVPSPGNQHTSDQGADWPAKTLAIQRREARRTPPLHNLTNSTGLALPKHPGAAQSYWPVPSVR